MKRRDQIVVSVLTFVVDRRPALNQFLKGFGVKDLAFPCRAPNLFGERQNRSPVAVRHAKETAACLVAHRQDPALQFLGALQQCAEAVLVVRLECENPGTGQQGRVEFE